MESKKANNDTRIEDKQQKNHNYLLSDKREKCLTKSSDIKYKNKNTTSQFICSNKDTSINIEDNIPKRSYNDIIEANITTATEITKYSNFEYEEEWDIGGIPELLNDLDADIEKSLKVDHNIQTSCSGGNKNIAFIKKEFLKIIPKKNYEKDIKNNNLKESEKKSALVLSETTPSKTKLKLNVVSSSSKFAGFSKGGHLISTAAPDSIFPFSETESTDSVNCKVKFDTLKHLKSNGCTTSMSSQAGSNSNSSSTTSGGGISNITSGQSGSCTSTTTKSNNKMSIDHQATLDKGLKMKIKRTKPGSKSSEAKHEIVKASEQQQNGLTRADVCTSNQDDSTILVTSSNLASSNSTQNSNNIIGNNSLQASNNSIGSKKNLGNCNNQVSSNISSSNNNGNVGNSAGTSNSTSQSTPQGTKRGNSGHRRDKTKEKSSHSNRTGGSEKNPSINNEKELPEKFICQCGNVDSNIACSNNLCIRTTESTTLTPQTIICSNNTTIPPGVFTPSADISSVAVSDPTLLTTSVSSTPVVSHSPSNSGSPNAPGPPTKDITGNGGNIKISSHIAAQLAAVAASNGSNSSVATLSNSDLKLAPSDVTNQITKTMTPGLISATVHHKLPVPVSTNKTNNSISSLPFQVGSSNSTPCTSADDSLESPPAKRAKHSDCNMATGTTNVSNKEMVDICVGTSVGTITEPDCLGPCEPGTSVTLEGIVWHETEGGVLVVNVTWRGKTYVGTLLDCTRHDWAPPRFCDSPTEDLDSRTPKGRGKRGRAAITPDLSNFTETRSSIYFSHSHVHSKLRNGASKGGRGTSRTSSVLAVDKTNSGSSLSSGNGESTPSTSPTAFLPPRTEKRKSKDDSPSPVCGENDSVNTSVVNASGIPISANGGGLTTQPQSLINPVTGLNVQISTKKCKIASPCAISPILLECPEQDCSKKYKHANGLRYHQSHAHGSTLLDEDLLTENEEHPLTPLPSPILPAPIPVTALNSSDLPSTCEATIAPKQLIVQDSEDSNTKVKTSDEDVPSLETGQSDLSSPINELTQSLTCEGLLIPTTTESSNTMPTLTPAGGSITAGTSHLGQQKEFVELGNININKNPLLSLEPTNQITQKSLASKSGVLRYGQGGESKICTSSSVSTPSQSAANTHQLEAPAPQTSSLESAQSMLRPLTPGDDINASQLLNSESYNKTGETSEKTTQPNHNKQQVASLNLTSSISVVAKQKKNRKSPAPDYDTSEINSCNISTREDVQSPAYSDISDDSTPVHEQDVIDKLHLSKNSDTNKKSQEIGLHSVLPSTGSQHNMTSALGGYGVYQFYQQQQFMAPPPLEQQSSKHSLISNIGQSCAPHQSQVINEFNDKKEPPLDLITKPSLSQQHLVQQDVIKESNRQLSGCSGQGGGELSSLSSMSSGTLTSTPPSKPVSHFYAFNYMSPNYPFNVDPNYGSVPVTNTEDGTKINRQHSNDPPQQQHPSVLYKDDRSKDANCPNDAVKTVHQQIVSNKAIKSEPSFKSENIKQEPTNTASAQIQQQVPLHNKDLQGMSVFSNIYQRHPLTLAPQQLSREEELRRYYIFSDQQRRQNNTTHQGQSSTQSSHQQCKEDVGTLQLQHQQQIKIKSSNSSLNIINISGKSTTIAKESPKHKQEDDLKIIKQEGQKPTMETQGPPPPPTSQYFLHPSYIASAPFGFDPSHPMYRNVLMPATSPYNTPPYHLPIPRYHAPEDLSRNSGTKALDALHHAASQYYTTHKIHELSERALKSPNSSSSNTGPGSIKVSGSSPNMGGNPLSNINTNIVGHHPVQNQTSGTSQLPHNLTSQTIGSVSNKQDISGQKTHVNNSGVQGTSINEPKSQASVNPSIGLSNSGNTNSSGNINGGTATDSRSPPPQRHVHTHHHTHVGLGYPMYPAPYGAAVLASQQAAAVAVINPFPPGPNK